MRADRFYITTAIFYPSAKPALHSLFEAIGADAIARYNRMAGRQTRFLTGMDEHSANVERAAREERAHARPREGLQEEGGRPHAVPVPADARVRSPGEPGRPFA